MNKVSSVYQKIHEHLLNALTSLRTQGVLNSEAPLDSLVIEYPKNPHWGDFSTNAAMILKRYSSLSSQALAAHLCDELSKSKGIASVNVAGPGFVNIFLEKEIWIAQLPIILAQGLSYGSSLMGQGKRVNLEYVSANPTGPLHAGHGRNAILGDALASLLQKAGYTVIREYYMNDAGSQIETLAQSTYLRYRQALGEPVAEEAFVGLYPGEYLVTLGKDLAEEVGNRYRDVPLEEALPFFQDKALQHMMTLIRDDLKAVGIEMDVYTSEKALTSMVPVAIQHLKDQGEVYEGTLERPKGHDLEDWEPRPQMLFRSTTYGDDVDRPLQKSDGTWTYFAGDIAYHYHKLSRQYDHLITVLGADHAGYLKRIQAATRALSRGKTDLEVQICQMVNFLDQGIPVRMSKRSGHFIQLREVVEKVGKDATRFFMLTRHPDMSIDFDFAAVLDQSKDNPVFYVQYAHARAYSVLRHARSLGISLPSQEDGKEYVDLLGDEAELALIKELAQWPSLLESAAQAREPHRITGYLGRVAGAFHALWNRGKDQVDLRFIDQKNLPITRARLLLIQCLAIVIANGLSVLGITPLEEMKS